MKKMHAMFHNNQCTTEREVGLTVGTNCLSSQSEKSNKNDLTIISKPHTHPHTMNNTYAKFQNDWYKTVRGVALTRNTHCLYTEGEK